MVTMCDAACSQQKIKDTITEQVKWLPRAIAHLPILPTLDTFFGDEHPIPTTFNRHASVHAVSAVQYTDANAVVALMLATAILRDAHHVEYELPNEDEPAAGSTSDLTWLARAWVRVQAVVVNSRALT